MEDLAELSRPKPLISDAHEKCFKSFKGLVAAIEHPVRDFSGQISASSVRNEFDRYKVWAGNVGAMHRGRPYQISLDYRLSEAAFYRQQVICFLNGLIVNIQKALEVLEGKRKPAEELEQELQDSLRSGSDLSSEEGSPLLTCQSTNISIFYLETGDHASKTNVKKDKSGTSRNDGAQESVKVSQKTTPHSQFSGSRRTGVTKASLVREDPGLEDEQKILPLESFSEYAPSMASSYATKLRVEIPDRPRDKNGEELQDFKCPYCFIVGRVENRDSWKRHIFRDIRPYVCTFQDCELYEQMFEKRDDWYQHESQSHRVEWRCGQENHPGYADKEAFLAHMSAYHNATVNTAQSSIFLSMFEQQSRSQKGACCLCLREAENLKTHLAHHLEQIALFALPRENEIPEMDSGANMRGTARAVSEKTSLDSRSEHFNSQDGAFVQAMERASQRGGGEEQDDDDDDDDEKISAVNRGLISGSVPDDANFSWTDIYQKEGASDQNSDKSRPGAFAFGSGAFVDVQCETHPFLDEEKINLENTDNRQRRILQWLNAPDTFQIHNAKLKGALFESANWFLNSLDFSKWKTSPRSFIWLYGVPGCGKSTLTSRVIETVLGDCSSDRSVAILCFYFKYEDMKTRRCERMIRSLIVQLITQNSSTSQVLESLFSSHIDSGLLPGCEQLMVALHRMMSGFREIYLIIDALDECLERRDLLAYIKEFTSWRDVIIHTFTTSREERDIEESIKSCNNGQGVVCVPFMATSSIKDKIRGHVHESLCSDPRLNEWQEVQLEIEAQLTDDAMGVYVSNSLITARLEWVDYHLESLRQCVSIDEVRECLESIPEPQDEIYIKMLCKIREEDSPCAFKILRWLVCTARPLEFREVAEVVNVDVRGKLLERNTGVNLKEPQDVLKICHELLYLDEKTSPNAQEKSNSIIVRLAHESLKDYLGSERVMQGDARHYGFRKPKAHSKIYKLCLAYISEICEQEPIVPGSDTLNEFPLAEYAARYWTHHAQIVERGINFDPTPTIQFLTKGAGLLNWIRMYNPDEPTEGADFERNADCICSPLYYASITGLARSVEYLIDDEEFDVNAQEGRHANALEAASAYGHLEVVHILLNAGANINTQGREYRNALQAASTHGHLEIVQKLLDAGADINARGGLYEDALQAASAGGHDKVVQTLLNAGANINTQGGEYGNALQAASAEGHKKVVQVLLDAGADINAEVRGHFRNALQAASNRGREQVVQILLDHGADINAQGGEKYENALQAASGEGHEQVVQILLDHGVDAQGEDYAKALEIARRGGFEGIVQMLLDERNKIDHMAGFQRKKKR